MASGGVRWLLLQAARHPVMQRVGDQMRMKTPADHGGELVVRGAQVGAQQASYVRGVALQAGVVLMKTGSVVMVVVRGHE